MSKTCEVPPELLKLRRRADLLKRRIAALSKNPRARALAGLEQQLDELRRLLDDYGRRQAERGTQAESDERREADRLLKAGRIDNYTWFRRRLNENWRRARAEWLDRQLEKEPHHKREVHAELGKAAKEQKDNEEDIRQAWQALGTERNRRTAIEHLDRIADEAAVRARTEGAGPEGPPKLDDLHQRERRVEKAAATLVKHAERFTAELDTYRRAIEGPWPGRLRKRLQQWAWRDTFKVTDQIDRLVRKLRAVKAVPRRRGQRGQRHWSLLDEGILKLVQLICSATGMKETPALDRVAPLLFACGVWPRGTSEELRAKYFRAKKRHSLPSI